MGREQGQVRRGSNRDLLGECESDRVRLNKMEYRGEGLIGKVSGRVSASRREFSTGKWRVGERVRSG